MNSFDFFKAYDYFSDLSARNILVVGEDFNIDSNKIILEMNWNLIFCMYKNKTQVLELQSALQRDNRKVKLLDTDLEDAVEQKKLTHQYDHRNLNLISLWNEEKSERKNKNTAQKIIELFCVESIQRFGFVYFIGYSENNWFDCNLFMNSFSDIYERTNCVIIDGCKNKEFTMLKEFIEHEPECNCFNFVDEYIAEKWAEYFTFENSSVENNDEYDFSNATTDKYAFFVNKKLVSISKKEVKDISDFAILLDYEELNPSPKPKFLHRNYFASFLKNDTSYPKWYGYAEKYNITRHFQSELTKCVKDSLNNPANFEHRPILLHGQSGVGKSVALGQLAYDIFHEKQYPVIYITNPRISFSYDRNDHSVEALRYQALFSFIQYLQDQCAAKTTLLIWDCSGFESERTAYRNLYSHLRNGGLNVALVGTNYQLNERTSDIKNFYNISAKIELDKNEKAELRSILKNKAKLDASEIDTIITHGKDSSFLSVLYSIFWDMRSYTSRGIASEMHETIKDILNIKPTANNGLFGTIIVNNYKKFNEFIFELDTDTENRKKLTDFTIYTSILTYFNMSISIDMICGLLTNVDMNTLIKILNAPIFHIDEVSGVAYYRIRSRLEAEMILRTHDIFMTRPDNRPFVVYICKLLYYIENQFFSSNCIDEAVEIVTRIISLIGPNNSENTNIKWNSEDFNKYAPCFINALSYAGKYHPDPRIVIQELALTRELRTGDMDVISYNEFKQILNEAREYYEQDEFFEIYGTERYLPDLSEKIERGKSFLRENEDCSYNLKGYYIQIRIDIANGMIKTANNSIDILENAASMCDKYYSDKYAITTWLRAKAKILTLIKDVEEQYNYVAMEAIDRIFHVIQQEPELTNDTYFVQACKTIFEVFENNIDINSLCEKLHSGNPTSAMIYLCAFQECVECGIITIDRRIGWQSIGETDIVQSIYEKYFNEKYKSIYSTNVRCLNLQLRLFWLLHNCMKQPLTLSGEKQLTGFTIEQWNTINEICENGINVDETSNTFYLRYVRGLAQAQMGNFTQCEQELTKIKRESGEGNYYQRPIPKYLLCEPNGTTRKFIGTVNNNGKMDVITNAKLLKNIYFNKRNLNSGARIAPEKGMQVDDLCIGVGYMGISATREKTEVRE